MSGSRYDEIDTAVSVLKIIPAYKLPRPRFCGLQIFKGFLRILWPILQSLEQLLRVWIVITHRRTAEKGNDPQPLQSSQHRNPLHRSSVVWIQYRFFRINPISQTGLLNQHTGQLGRLLLMNWPAHDHPAPYINHQVQLGQRTLRLFPCLKWQMKLENFETKFTEGTNKEGY